MTISELIIRLQELQAEHGDLLVCAHEHEAGGLALVYDADVQGPYKTPSGRMDITDNRPGAAHFATVPCPDLYVYIES